MNSIGKRQNPNPIFDTSIPRFKLPAGAIDCHCHIYDDFAKYPLCENPVYLPPAVKVADYLKMLDVLGVQRAVIVHANIYGLDNSLALDLMASAPTRFRAVALMDEAISDEEIERLHHAGVRGFRCNLVGNIGLSLEKAKILGARVKQYGWHTQFLLDIESFPNLEEVFSGFPIDIVIDHMGRPIIDRGINAPGFQALLKFIQHDHVWVKLSAPYRTSQDHLYFKDIEPFARALVAANSNQLVWGTDWPHVNMDPSIPMPNDGLLCNLLADWVPDESVREKILVNNPERLYGF